MIQNKTIMAEKVQINADKLKVLDAVMQKIEKDADLMIFNRCRAGLL